MSSTDSEAVFHERVEELGLTSKWIDMKSKGWNSFGMFAFASSWVPGNTDDAKFVDDVLKPLLGNDPSAASHRLAPALRRLYFESFTLMSSDLKRKSERTDEDAPRKMPILEKSERRERLQQKITGFQIEGENDPSYHLIDLMGSFVDDNALRYVRWEDCTTRESELRGVKKDVMWKPDANGIIKERSIDRSNPADLSTDLRLRHALTRRGLAFEMVDLMSFDAHEKLSNLLMREYLRPAMEDGFRRVSLEQVQRADMEIFHLATTATRAGIKRTAEGRPLDTVIPKLLDDPSVRLLLMQTQGSSKTPTKRKASASRSGSRPKGKNSEKNRRKKEKALELKKKLERYEKGGANKVRDDGGGKGAGKDGKKSGPRLPKQLIGKNAAKPDGTPLCFGFNLGTCKAVKPGESCSKGYHGCMEPGCDKDHPCTAFHK